MASISSRASFELLYISPKCLACAPPNTHSLACRLSSARKLSLVFISQTAPATLIVATAEVFRHWSQSCSNALWKTVLSCALTLSYASCDRPFVYVLFITILSSSSLHFNLFAMIL